MQNTARRLEPFKNEILKETAERGQFSGLRRAQELTGLKSIIAFRRWLREVTGNENFGLSPSNPRSIKSSYWIISRRLEQNFLEHLADLRVIAEKEAHIKELDKERKLLEWKFMEAVRQGEPASELKLAEV